MAKREEMFQHFRSAEAGECASKSVNECSFMERIVVVPFIGRVLSHRIAFNVLFKQKPFAFCKPHERRPDNRSSHEGQNLGRFKRSAQLYGKSVIRAIRFFTEKTSSKAPVRRSRKARGIMSREEGIVKKTGQRVSLNRLDTCFPAFQPGGVIPPWTRSLGARPLLSRCVWTANRQT